MTDRYYAEEVSFDGRPKPVVYHGENPGPKKSSGARRRFHVEPKLIDKCHHHLTLNQLREVYSPDGKFQATRPRLRTAKERMSDGKR